MKVDREFDALVAEKVMGWTAPEEPREDMFRRMGFHMPTWELFSKMQQTANMRDPDDSEYGKIDKTEVMPPAPKHLWTRRDGQHCEASTIPCFSTKILPAWDVIATMEEYGEHGCAIEMETCCLEETDEIGWKVDFCLRGVKGYDAEAGTIELAICLAALKVVEENEKMDGKTDSEPPLCPLRPGTITSKDSGSEGHIIRCAFGTCQWSTEKVTYQEASIALSEHLDLAHEFFGFGPAREGLKKIST